MENTLSCQLCSAASHIKFTMKSYIQHLRLFHGNQLDFRIKCGIGGCQSSYTNCGTFINHIYAIHPNGFAANPIPMSSENDQVESQDCISVEVANGSTGVQQGCDMQLSENYSCYSPETAKKLSASFLLGLKEKFKLTQVSIQGIIHGVTALDQYNISNLKLQVCH